MRYWTIAGCALVALFGVGNSQAQALAVTMDPYKHSTSSTPYTILAHHHRGKYVCYRLKQTYISGYRYKRHYNRHSGHYYYRKTYRNYPYTHVYRDCRISNHPCHRFGYYRYGWYKHKQQAKHALHRCNKKSYRSYFY